MVFKFLRRKKSRQKARLGVRRKKVSTVKLIIGLITFLVFAGILIWVVRLEQLTVSAVYVEGNSIVSGEAIERITFEELSGTYALLIPKANSLFLPYKSIAREVKNSFFRIKEVSITKNNLASVTVTVTEREPFALWCGDRYVDTKEVLSTCYFLDTNGYVFAKAPDFSGSIFLKYFGVLEDGNGRGGLDPIGKYFSEQTLFGRVNNFVEAISVNGVVPVLIIRSDLTMEIVFEDTSRIRLDTDQDLTVLLDNYQSIIESEIFVTAKKEGLIIDYIDFHFGNKIFYKFR